MERRTGKIRGDFSRMHSDRRPRNWWSFMLCISNRNNTQEPDSEQETEGQEQSQINKSRKTRVTQRVQSEKEITRERITSAPIPETSQNIICSSHKIADMS